MKDCGFPQNQGGLYIGRSDRYGADLSKQASRWVRENVFVSDLTSPAIGPYAHRSRIGPELVSIRRILICPDVRPGLAPALNTLIFTIHSDFGNLHNG
jgi:hypothetical protein